MNAPMPRDIGGGCLLPFVSATHPHPGDQQAARTAPTAAQRLLAVLAEGGESSRVRDGAWGWARHVQESLEAGSLDRERALVSFDLLCATWSLADRLGRAWRALEVGNTAQAMALASLARQRVDELEHAPCTGGPLVERLRARIQALWQLADGFDEAAFLRDCDDQDGARERAAAVVRQASQLAERGALTDEELLLAEDLADRWGATSRWLSEAGGCWVS